MLEVLKISRMRFSEVSGTDRDQLLRDYVRDELSHNIERLAELVAIPSVSWPAFDASHVHRSAEWVATFAASLDFFETVEVSTALTPEGEQGMPAVLAARKAKPGFPHVVLYAHHDVQPPGESELWESPPFELTQLGERVYGRGAADDKAGVMLHLAAIDALRTTWGSDFPLGITLFVEGEEEYGSRSFEAFLEKHHSLLDGDVIVVADSDNVDEHTPALTVALRGNVTFLLRVRTLEHASHSGMFGGVVPDAMMAFARLVSSFYREDGSVAIEGLSSASLPDRDYGIDELRQDTGLVAEVIGQGSFTSRMWAQPSVTVTGTDAPRLADASNTLIPAVTARVSVRIAPDQPVREAWQAIEQHIYAHTPFGAEVSLDDMDGGEGFLVDTSGWAVQVMRGAMNRAWNREPMDVGIGGSIPFISALHARFPQAHILVTGVEDPNSRAHSPNESLHLGVWEKAILSEALFLADCARGRGSKGNTR